MTADQVLRGITLGIMGAQAERIRELEKIPKLKVRFLGMPESNGKKNWTVLLAREDSSGILGSIASGFDVCRSEYYDQMRYHADRLRFLIGETDTNPCILDYDPELMGPKEN